MTDLSTSQTNTFTPTGQIVMVTVGTAGYYDIEADGAQGGGASLGSGATGGVGAMASGEIYLAAGSKLEIVVGVAGQTGEWAGGGGGGSFVIEIYDGAQTVDINEVIAGGGGGGGSHGAGGAGQTTPTGGAGGGASAGAGGARGAAGAASANSAGGGGGGGFSGGGGGGYYHTAQDGATTGSSFAGGAAGSSGGGGGFGGGGGGGSYGGGGGGGYGGGGGGGSAPGVSTGGGGGGGGSYVTADAVGGTTIFGVATETAGGGGSVFITYEGPACYCDGSRILTTRGEIAVEDLVVGDVAVTASGAARPILWLGHRRVDIARHPNPSSVRPVRICAHAFGDDLPRRELWVSPGHNIFVEGVLIPAIALVNGVTVEQVERDAITYRHVELDAHDILLAEGLPAESYLDCGNRAAFANGGGAVALFPDFAPRDADSACYPLRKRGAEVEAAKARLFARAQQLGFVATAESDLHLLADGVRIAPLATDGRRHCFQLAQAAEDLRLVSRQWTPSHMRGDSADDRRLGVLATRLELDGVAQDLTTLGEGWHEPASADCRWTDGCARLPAGARAIVVETGADPLYWADGAGAAATLFGLSASAAG